MRDNDSGIEDGESGLETEGTVREDGMEGVVDGEREEMEKTSFYAPRDGSFAPTGDTPDPIDETPPAIRSELFPATPNILSHQASAPTRGPPNHINEKNPLRRGPFSKLDVLANESLAEDSWAGETTLSGSRTSYPQTPRLTEDSELPLKNLREGRLLQYYVTHLAPWVRTN